MPALDWGTRAHLEHRAAGRFAGVHFYRGSESCLRPGQLPISARFRQDLAATGVSEKVADSCSPFYLLTIRPLRLLRRDLSRSNVGRWSSVRNSTATGENTFGNGGYRSGGRRVIVHLFARRPSSPGILVVLA